MVEIKLEALVLADSYEYNQYQPIIIPYVPKPDITLDYNVFYHGSNLAFLNELDNNYGLFYKFLVGYNSSNQVTLGLITEWDAEFFYVLNWNNSNPAVGSIITLTYVLPKPYISTAGIIFNAGDNLIEDSLTISRQIESLKKMDLRVSRASFDLIESDALKTFINNYWTDGKHNGYYHVLAVHIKEDGVGRFWGYIKPDNIIYDVEEKIYTIDSYDWLKFILDTKGQNYLPDYKTINLQTFLEDNLVVFNSLDIQIEGMSQIWDSDDWNYILDGDTITTVETQMSVEDMVVECMKYYCASIYYDGDKNLVFRNRLKAGSIRDINDKIVSGDFTKNYRIRDYDSLLINVQGEWRLNSQGVYEQYSGWALVWYDNGDLQSLVVNGDLGNIQGRKYLDIRQRIPYETFQHRLFQSLNREDVLNYYRDLLENANLYEATLIGTDYELYDDCLFEGNRYLIKSCEIDFSSKTTNVLLEKFNGN